MKKNYVHLVLVVDRSGSMFPMAEEASNGINQFLREQHQLEGEATITLAQFNHEYELVHDFVPTKKAIRKPFKLVPRGCTALLDALGRTISSVGDALATLEEENRPEKVIFLVCTDGEENASEEFTMEQVRNMIQHQETAYKWEFVYLGANVDAFTEANNLGINVSTQYAGTGKGVSHVYSVATRSVSDVRTGRSANMASVMPSDLTEGTSDS